MAVMPTADGRRQAFQRQPARAVLLDLRPPMDMSTCLNVQEALSSTLGLIQNIEGASRLPYFSLMALGNYPECILPLQAVKGNYPRILTALNQLKLVARDVSVDSRSRGCVLEGLQETLVQFHRLNQTSRSAMGGQFSPTQIEITLVTSQAPQQVHKTVEAFTAELDLVHLRKITAVCVRDLDQVLRHRLGRMGRYKHREEEEEEQEEEEAGNEMTLSPKSDSPSELGLSILDVISVDSDSLSVCDVFKSWLQDCTTDSEHLHLCLPTSLGETPLILKCDMQERFINPSSIPAVRQHFTLHTGSGPNPAVSGRISSSTFIPSHPIHTLRAVSLVKQEGVCESLLFGIPHILRPTACWKLDWEELEANQHNFSSLCQVLIDKGQFLLAAMDLPPTPLHPHFLILPSPAPSSSLLVKSIAVEELMVPADVQMIEEQPTQQAMQKVDHCLAQLHIQESYNPLTVQSSLHEALSLTTNKRGPLSRGRAFHPDVQASSGSLGRGESLDRGGLPGRGGPPGRGSSGHSLGPKRQCLKGGRGYKGI